MTALKAHEVARFVEAPDLGAGVYLVYGTDAGLIREIGQRLLRHFAGDSPDPMAHTTLDMAELDADPGRLAIEARTPSLFGGNRTVRVRNAGKGLTPTLSVLLDDMPQAVIVLEATNLNRGDALRALAESHKLVRALPCYADDEKSLGNLIRHTLTEAQISYPPEVVATLRNLLGNDREVTRRELEKLVLFAHHSKQLSVADIETVCGDNTAQAIDSIIDSVGAGHAAQFEDAYRSAMAAGIDPQRILAIALMHFANLRRLRVKVDAGKTPRAALEASRPRPHFSRMASMERQLRLWSDDALASASSRIYAAILSTRKQASLSAAITQRALLAICVAAAQR